MRRIPEVIAGVYLIYCTCTGYYYVGYSNDIRERLLAHSRLLARGTHQNAGLQRDYWRFGKDSFRVRWVKLQRDYGIMKRFKANLMRAIEVVGTVYNTLLPMKKNLSIKELIEIRDSLVECYRSPCQPAFETVLAKRASKTRSVKVLEVVNG